MGFFRYFRKASTMALIGVFLITSLFANPAYSLDTKDSQLFITGFNAYLKRDYPAAIANLSEVLEKYPETSLRDMSILWLSRAYFKAGDQKEAAQYMAQFLKEYPESPLKGTIEDELVELAGKYQGGESFAAQQSAQVDADRQAAEALALAKAEADRQAAEKLILAKAEADRQAAEKLALAKAEADRQAAETLAQAKAEADRLAAEEIALAKAEKDRQTAEKLALAKAETDRQAAEKLALAKAEADRLEAERLFFEKSAADRQAAEKLAQVKVEADRLAAEKLALAKTESGRQAAEKLAVAKAETDRQTAEKLALEKADADQQAAGKLAAAKAETEIKTVAATEDQKKTKSAQSIQLQDQAIAEYKAVIARYPGTKAAANAALRLKELGVKQQMKTVVAPVAPVQSGENSNIFSVEVARQADLEFVLAAEAYTVEVGKRISVPFEVLNRGNSPDSFTLESGLPGEYRPLFLAADTPDLPLVKTSQLMPGERFKGLLQFEMPNMSLDGERKLFPVKAHSEADSSISQSRPLKMTAKAPILRAVIKSDVTQATPGDRIPYRLVLLNVGSSDAKEVSLRLVYPPQYEPVDSLTAGFRNEGDDALVISGLQLKPGESKDVSLTMKLKDSALAKEELFLHAALVNTVLKRTDNFVSAAVEVNVVRGVKLHATADKVIAIPGQTVTIPLTASNTGNVRDNFNIKSELPVNLNFAFYLDMNGDGIRQSSEPRVDNIGPLAPKEVANLLLEVTTAAAEKDGVAVPLSIMLDSTGDASVHGAATISLTYSRPVLNLNLTSTGGKVKPGEVNTFELSCINVGSSMAKLVDIRSSLPEQMELIASEPAIAGKTNQDFFWRFDQLGSGEKRIVKISYRIKSGTAVGTALELKNTLVYQDQVGNSY